MVKDLLPTLSKENATVVWFTSMVLPTARRVQLDDIVIVASYAMMEKEEAKTINPVWFILMKKINL